MAASTHLAPTERRHLRVVWTPKRPTPTNISPEQASIPMRMKVIKGKRIGLPPIVETLNYQCSRPFESDPDLIRLRKLLFKNFFYDQTRVAAYPPIVREMKRISFCKLGCLAAEKPTLANYKCGSLLCPHCRQNKIDMMPFRVLRRLEQQEDDGLTLITLKMPACSPSFPYRDQHGLRAGIERIKRSFAAFRRIASRVYGLTIRGGVYGVHTFWQQITKTWDIHLHVIVVGPCSPYDMEILRRIWSRLSGRRDRHAFHTKPITGNLHRVLAYVTPGMVSTFYDRADAPSHISRNERAYAVCTNHLAALAEWLDAIRPKLGTSPKRSTRLVNTFGYIRKSTVRQIDIGIKCTRPPALPFQKTSSLSHQKAG